MRRTLTVLLLLLALSAPGLAEDGVGGGRLLDAKGRVFPLEHTEVTAEITGPVARVTVAQTFANPHRSPIEAVYQFPLPDRAGIDDLRIQIGSRVIRAELMSRMDAMRTYRKAKNDGQTAALTTQIRPNLFSQKIANILPGERILVELTYVEDLRYEDGGYSFVFPMVAAPRYTNKGTPDGHRLPRTFLDKKERPGHDIEIDVALDAGVPIGEILSESHVVDVYTNGGTRARVRLHPADSVPNKDFLLSWTVAGDEPVVGVIAHRVSAAGYFTLMIQPEEKVAESVVLPREVVFVVDCSGSMSGLPLETAKRVVSRTLETLSPNDTFQILRFSDKASGLHEVPLPATPANIRLGLAYIDQMRGSGGTEILGGLKKALQGRREPYRLRIVHFLTDGLVGNEGQILAELQVLLQGARVFPLGVGTSVNRFLLERMAEVGRGAVSYIRHLASEERIEQEVERFVSRIRQPSLTNIEIDWGGLPVDEIVPRRLPDLFAGQPLVVTGRYLGPAEGEVVIRGYRGGRLYEQKVTVSLPEWWREHSALEKLWARGKLRELMLAGYGGEITDIQAEAQQLALDHGLLSQYTAFVAVDERVVVSRGGTRTVRQPAPWPEGMGSEEYFGILTARAPQVKTRKPTPYRPPLSLPRDSRPSFAPIDEISILHLAYLRRFQEKQGHWSGSGDLLGDVGATSLALLAYRAAGYTRTDGTYANEVSRGLRALSLSRHSSGRFGPDEGPAWLLDHTLATIASLDYCAASGWKKGWRQSRSAVKYLVSEQHPELGWSKDGSRNGGDVVTTALAIMALRRAEAAGMTIDAEVWVGARNFLESVTDRITGKVRMTCTSSPKPIDGTAIAAGILARVTLGANATDSFYLRKGADLLLKEEPPVGQRANALYLFLSTAALARMGGEHWGAWNPPLDKASRVGMIPTHSVDEDGNPLLMGPPGIRLGRSAAMSLFGLARSYYDGTHHPFPGR